CGGWRGAIERHVIREFFDRGFGVGCCQVFVERLEEQVQVKSRFVALKLLKCSCDDGSGKAGLIPNEGVGLAGHRTGAGPLCGSSIADALFSASDHLIFAGSVTFIVAVERLIPYAFTGEQPPALSK